MGQLIVLADRLADRSRPSADVRTAFFFDLANPFSYLASEHVERTLGEVEWVPLSGTVEMTAAAAAQAERLAASLRLPLVWPESVSAVHGQDGAGDALALRFPRAARAAAYAAGLGRAGAFALAAGRLAFCGGYDLDDPEILADAADAAAIPPRDVLAAAASARWDAQPLTTAAGLRRRGVPETPAIRIGMAWRSGPHALAEAGALLRAVDAQARTLRGV